MNKHIRNIIGVVLTLALIGVLASSIRPNIAAVASHVPPVAFHTGDVFPGMGNGLINQYSPAWPAYALLDTLTAPGGSTYQSGMCFDTAGNLYTTNLNTASMSKFDNMGNLLGSGAPSGHFTRPESCTINAAGHIFVGDSGGGHQILEFDKDGIYVTSYTPAPVNMGSDWIDLAADQHTMYYTSESPLIKRYDVGPSPGQLSNFAILPTTDRCFDLRIRPSGEVMVACDNEAYLLDSNAGLEHTYPASDYPGSHTYWFALSLDPDGTSFWTADVNSGRILHIRIVDGKLLDDFTRPTPNGMAGLAIYGEPRAAQSACPCPMDVAFVLDTTGSVQTTLPVLQNLALDSILGSISNASGGNYRLSLVTFKDDISVWENGVWTSTPAGVTAIKTDINSLINAKVSGWTLPGGISEPEASDEALNTVVNNIIGTTRPIAGAGFPCVGIRLQHGETNSAFCTSPSANFANWLPGRKRVVIFLTDARPGGFTDNYAALPPLVTTLYSQLPKYNIQVIAIGANAVGSATAPSVIAAGITANYANVSAGYSIPTNQSGIPLNTTRGTTVAAQIGWVFNNICAGLPPRSIRRQVAQDVNGDYPFYRPITILMDHAVISGYACGGTNPPEPCIPPDNLPYFRPDSSLTRGQVSKIIANAAAFTDTIPSTRQTFTDVPYTNPFWVYIERLFERGLISGYSSSPPCTTGPPCFLPSANVTRNQLAKIVSNAAGFTDVIPSTRQTFTDVPFSNAFWVYIERLNAHQATTAISCGDPATPCNAQQQPYFLPGSSATRAETALFTAASFYPLEMLQP